MRLRNMKSRRQQSKTLFVACALLLLVASLEAADLTVSITNTPSSGTLRFLFFDSEDGFDGFRAPCRIDSFQCNTQALYRIESLPEGQYALLVYHDQNRNKTLDRNFIGIPKEPVGFSNRYSPKGPPQFRKALFHISDDKSNNSSIQLSRPLGKRGRVGVGVGIIGRSSPYSNSNKGPVQVIPAITYIGERIQILGPNAQIGLMGSNDLRLAATLAYRLGSYEESDSPVLQGLDDRKQTMMGGLALEWELASGADISLAIEHDMLNRINASTAQIGIKRPFSLGSLRLSPALAINWQNANAANHDFGIPDDRATTVRPAYKLNDTISIESGLGAFLELNRNWKVILNLNVEFLDPKVRNSPIISEDYVLKGFAAINVVL